MRRTEIERLLPEVFRATIADGAPLAALLDTMASLHAPDEAVLDDLDGYFDPSRTDDRFVPLLSRWVDLERLFMRSATGAICTAAIPPSAAAAQAADTIASWRAASRRTTFSVRR